ncbi:glycosyltransferase family 39 protein [Dokdonella soli]|uniref:Glycosyltransferase RgtA/B/C/D-like domain-containing protein n=1 Tax=Dokdonella soli TaxID=529810 RepID=A0ABN1IGG6_9GAMM
MNPVAPGVARRRQRLAALFVALFALSQALLWFAYYAHGAKPLIGDEQGYQDTALAILAGGAWMPNTIWPPLQPLLLAAIYTAFGAHVLAAQIVQTLLFVACAALLRDLWRRLGGSVAAANTAAALFLLNPATAAYAQWLWPEIPHLFLLLAALCLLARAPSRLSAFAAGACIALAILAKSLLSAFWPAFLIAFLRRERPHLLLRPAALFVLGLALVTAPALWHGWRAYGRPMIADSSVYNLWIGLTDRWRSDYVEDMGGATLPAFIASGTTPQERNAAYLEKLRALVAERGLAATLAGQFGRQYFRLFSVKTPLVSQLPGPACAGHLSVYRTSPWLTRTLTVANDWLHALMLAAAAFGIVCWRWRRMPAGALRPLRDPLLAVITLLIAYQLGLMLLIHVKARFLLPLLPFLCGFAGSFLAALRRHLAARSEDVIALTPMRLALGALLAVLLLFLAFAGPALDHLCAG